MATGKQHGVTCMHACPAVQLNPAGLSLIPVYHVR